MRDMSKHLGDRLVDYTWDTLTPRERVEVEAHLRECADCRAELAHHQSLVSRLGSAIPAMLPPVPPRVRAGWPAVAQRIPRLRPAAASRRRGSAGLVAVGLAMSAAVLLFVAVTAQAWFGLRRPTLTATAVYTSLHATPIASVTTTPEATPTVVTPPRYLYSDGWGSTLAAMQAPRPQPVVGTARP
jgi:anti-sigma factor RsiW